MATQAQTDANRVNAKKSTGPRTPEGKAAVSQNAVKHGLFAHEAVINGENPADFDLHRDAFLAEMRPVGAMESMLAERIVSLSWRLRRTERMQNQAIDEMIEGLKPSLLDKVRPRGFRREAAESEIEPRMALGRVAKRDWANDRVLDRLMIYERRIESSMLKTMRELEKLQLMRNIEEAGAAEGQRVAETRHAGDHEGDLKKQSQSSPALADVSSFDQGDYEQAHQCRAGGNKPSQSQFQSDMPPLRAGSVVSSSKLQGRLALG